MRRFLVACVALVLLAVPAMAEDEIGEEVLPDDTVSVPVVDIPPSDDVLEDLPVGSEEDTPPVVCLLYTSYDKNGRVVQVELLPA